MTKPKIVTDEHMTFMDGLQKSGILMRGTVPDLMEKFDLGHKEAKEILMYWLTVRT